MQSCWLPAVLPTSALRCTWAHGRGPLLCGWASGTCSLKEQNHFTSHIISNKYICFILDISRWIWQKTASFTHRPGGVYAENRESSWRQQVCCWEWTLPCPCSGVIVLGYSVSLPCLSGSGHLFLEFSKSRELCSFTPSPNHVSLKNNFQKPSQNTLEGREQSVCDQCVSCTVSQSLLQRTFKRSGLGGQKNPLDLGWPYLFHRQ